MEEERMDEISGEESSYVPRPVWQVWLARIALVIFLALIAMYYLNIAGGGL